ncbi:MAG: hypothetical protein ACYDH3_00940 [Candidatus Aminicenantales bacterium]
MSRRGWLKGGVHKGAAKMDRRLSRRKPAIYVAASLGVLVLAVAVFILVFGDAILSRYGKEKIERAFAEAYPRSKLQIGDLDYSIKANRLILQSGAIRAPDMNIKVGRISLTGVRWVRLLWGKAALTDVLAKSGLEATNVDVEFPRARYGIRSERIRVSEPGSELIAEQMELRPLVGDEAFFAAHDFRTTRFHVIVPECRMSGLAYGELLQGKSYRAKSIHLSLPSFEALVNTDKPSAVAKSPLMVNEALASIRRPLQVDRLSVTNGHIGYCERPVVSAAPGILTFGAVSLSAEGITNRGGAAAAIKLRAQGDLMNTGTIKVQMSIPLSFPNFSLHYSGSLGAMDLSRLSPFLDIVEHLRIKSGNLTEATFEIDVTAGRARGQVRATYKDFMIAVLDSRTGAEEGFASFLANLFKIRNSNATNASGSTKSSQVNYTRKPDDTFLGFVWSALRSGLLDIIRH